MSSWSLSFKRSRHSISFLFSVAESLCPVLDSGKYSIDNHALDNTEGVAEEYATYEKKVQVQMKVSIFDSNNTVSVLKFRATFGAGV